MGSGSARRSCACRLPAAMGGMLLAPASAHTRMTVCAFRSRACSTVLLSFGGGGGGGVGPDYVATSWTGGAGGGFGADTTTLHIGGGGQCTSSSASPPPPPTDDDPQPHDDDPPAADDDPTPSDDPAPPAADDDATPTDDTRRALRGGVAPARARRASGARAQRRLTDACTGAADSDSEPSAALLLQEFRDAANQCTESGSSVLVCGAGGGGAGVSLKGDGCVCVWGGGLTP